MYEPEVDDYVIWDQGEYGKHEGWVYFKGDKEEKKRGFRDNPRYITIEIGVKDKPKQQLDGSSSLHNKIHTLLLCYESSWHELKFVKHRRTREIQHYSQYDDVSGNEENKGEDNMSKMYKSQKGRPPDY